MEDPNSCYPKESFLATEISQDIICPICFGIIKSAVVDHCGHSFGKKCIQK